MATAVDFGKLITEGDMCVNWATFRRRFETYIAAYHADAKDAQKIGILLYHGGEYLQDVYDTNMLKTETTIDKILIRLDEYFIPKTNLTYERYKMFTRKQDQEETFEQYVTALKKLSQSCNFGSLRDEIVRDLFICGLRNPVLQRQLLGLSELSLEKAVAICRHHAIVDEQVNQFEKVGEIKVKKEVDIDIIKKKMNNKECQYCGFRHEYGRCPAYGKTCAICKRKNHFAKKCRSKKVNILEESCGSDTEYQVAILALDQKTKYPWYCVKLQINKLLIDFKVDSGAQCNVLSEKQFLKLGKCSSLQKTNVRITSFTNGKVPIIGKCVLTCQYKTESYPIEFYIVKSDCYNLLGLETSEVLGLIKRVDEVNKSLNSLESVIPERYHDLFDGSIGCVPHIVKLEVNEDVKPVVSPARRLPYSLMPKVKQELDNLVEKGIIAKVAEPTDWDIDRVATFQDDVLCWAESEEELQNILIKDMQISQHH
ncbi:uncharacterized protein LOC135071571 [Ostrinia nubilalis]|uniref:uncharacterized protein LOC135071571 n=1 Tax=Ostrinia nubilalis TaxID=29057 RepID=UPI0030824ACC